MRILLVDDEPMSRQALANFLDGALGHEVIQCNQAERALELFGEYEFQMVLSDIRMPGMSGHDLLQSIRGGDKHPSVPFVLMTGFADTKSAVKALREGAEDYLLKPVDVSDLAKVVERIEQNQQQNTGPGMQEEQSSVQDPDTLRGKAFIELEGEGRIGVFSENMRNAISMAQLFQKDRSVPVLIEGETGTGKEIIAKFVHYGEEHVDTPFVSINCTAIPGELFESELFGYEEGAFTGARRGGAKGRFEQAHGGTFFLDEIGDMPLDLQPKLLRALQQKEIYRVGGDRPIQTDVRIITATNRPLKELVQQGLFRQDLYYRLDLGRIHLPPLRERREAIGPLAQMFLTRFAQQKGRRFRFISNDALRQLQAYHWPGNIRELQNALNRAVLLFDDIELQPEHIGFLQDDPSQAARSGGSAFVPGNLRLPDEPFDLQALEEEIIRKALEKFDGNKSRAARYLGLTRNTLRSRLRRIGEG
ncbi:response regulator [bacterium]|nr:response regulator [bacterium]